MFEFDSNLGGDLVSFSPATSSLAVSMEGNSYTFTPLGFSAGTINAGTLNASTINGAISGASITSGTIPVARLAGFVASGTGHAAGIVPDPGATIGSTRFLREDGTWVAAGSGSFGMGTTPGTNLMGSATAAASNAPTVAGGTGLQSFEVQGDNPANARSTITFSNKMGGSLNSAFEFGTDFGMSGTKDFYIYNYATGHAAIDISPSDNVTLTGSLSANLYKGPTTAPSGSCTAIGWAFSQDGHATFCDGSTWVSKI